MGDPILIHLPWSKSFGNCAEELYFGLLKAKRENKKILFLYPQNLFFRKLAANQKLFHFHSAYSLQNKAVCYLAGWLLTLRSASMWLVTRACLNRCQRILLAILPKNINKKIFTFRQMTPTIERSTLWKPDGVNFFSWKIIHAQNWKRQHGEYVSPSLMEDDNRYADQLRLQMGIPLADWFVCLHVRESGIEAKRNASIQNYLKGIEVITDAGGWVVRIGDSSMTPLPALGRVVDYPHTRFKSELMDIYLISQSRFYWGTNSGPSDVATLFGKPMILVNVTEWSLAYPVKKGDLEIIRHVFSRSRNRFLSIREILEEPSSSQSSESFSREYFGSLPEEYTMVENTAEEITEVIQEFLAKGEEYQYSQLQNIFNESRRTQIRQWLDQMPEDSVLWRYRIASRYDSGCTLGQRYLEENWFTDSSSQNMAKHLAV